MPHNTARIGRRRRVLKEEVLTAGGTLAEDLNCAPGDTPRYGVGANIENHPQVTDLVPRRFRVIALVLGLGISAGAIAELAAHYSENLSDFIPSVSSSKITAVFANQLVAWTSATMLLVGACYARLLFSLRRHRVDDTRGRYRIWRTASWAAVALSLNAVIGGHTVVSHALGHLTGWSVLPGNAGWWIAAAALVGGWLLLKLILDTAECKSAMVVYVLALGCFIAAGVNSAGWSPSWAVLWSETMSRSLPLAGNLMLLVGSLLFARYVVLDVQGLIQHHSTPEQLSTASASRSKQSSPEPKSLQMENKKAPTDENAWVDGSEMESEAHSNRQLSKAERKRLRKQKIRNRVA